MRLKKFPDDGGGKKRKKSRDGKKKGRVRRHLAISIPWAKSESTLRQAENGGRRMRFL